MFPVWTNARLSGSIFDIFFFGFVLYFSYRLIVDWVTFYRATKKILAFCLDMWNLLEVVNIFTLLAVSILRWVWWTKSRSSHVAFPFDGEYPKDLDAIVLLYSAMIYANSINVVITVLKILKYFQLNNRLNILTRTLAVSQQGIIGVLALFFFVVAGYAICGVILYGSNLFAFKNLNTSFSSLSFMLLGQFDYPAMRALQPELTVFFFFTFMILGNFLLLNFIIAILSDGFATVSKDTALEPLDESIMQQIYLIQKFFTIGNLQRSIELRKKGKTRASLLREVHKYIVEHLDLIARHNPSQLDNDIPMTRDDMRNWLPEQLTADLGEEYFDTLWFDMAHDFKIDREAGSYTMHKEIEKAVQEGIGLVVRKEKTIGKLTEVHSGLSAVEELIDRVAQRLTQ
jgi:hypothetical protein